MKNMTGIIWKISKLIACIQVFIECILWRSFLDPISFKDNSLNWSLLLLYTYFHMYYVFRNVLFLDYINTIKLCHNVAYIFHLPLFDICLLKFINLLISAVLNRVSLHEYSISYFFLSKGQLGCFSFFIIESNSRAKTLVHSSLYTYASFCLDIWQESQLFF